MASHMEVKMINLLKSIYRNYKREKENKFFNNITPFLDLEVIDNIYSSSYKTIAFIVPTLLKFSGGHTSILRLGTYLSDFGYEVMYISYENQNADDMKKVADLNLKNNKGNFYGRDALNNLKSDIIISTSWESVYYAKKLNGYKMYFVQDYEPYFYTYGEKYILAKKTYELGFHIVSLGKWNMKMILDTCNNINKIEYIDFPYEKSEYNYQKRDFSAYKCKKKFNIAVYIKSNEKRSPYMIQEIVSNIKRDFKNKGIEINILYFGEDKSVKFKSGTNLGKLSKSQLLDLYNRCDFGMCASLTNISLVPYEMMATKLPVIEFKEGTFNCFFSDDMGILTTFDWKYLSKKLYSLINNPAEIEKLTDNALKNLEQLSWQSSAKQFDQIIKKISG